MRTLMLILALMATTLSVSPDNSVATDLYPKNPQVDIRNYAFHLTLSDATDEIRGRAVIDVAFNGAGETELWFDLVSATPTDGDASTGDNHGMRVLQVAVAQGSSEPRTARFQHADDRLGISLFEPSMVEGSARVVVDYAGTPATGLRIGPNKHGDRTFFSDNWPNRARNWLPTVDHPYDKATSEFVVTAPSRYQVISNGLLVEETDLQDGTRRTHWKQSVPIPSWLYVLGVAEFAVQYLGEYDGRSLQTWVYAKDRDDGFYDFAVPTKRALEFYGEYVGPYAYEKLANVQSASVGGGMEAASAIFYGENSVTGDRSVRWRNVIIHEVAHQWFGNAVTEYDWDDIWLSEGFATYFTLLFIEHAYGREEFVSGLRSAAERVWTWYDDNPDYRIVHDNLADMSKVTSIATYQKGAWVLHMLRNQVGDEAFWTGIRAYYAEHMNGSATTTDFRRAMEKTSGQQLEWFFEQWLYRGGNPALRGSWSYDAAGTVIVELEQGWEDGFAYRLPLEIGVYSGDRLLPVVHSVELDGLRGRYVLPNDGEPSRVVLDPNTRSLFQAEFVRTR